MQCHWLCRPTRQSRLLASTVAGGLGMAIPATAQQSSIRVRLSVDAGWGEGNYTGFSQDWLNWVRRTPVMHITPHWTWPGREGKPITVIVFSNAPTVGLSLNGVSLGRKTCPRNGHAARTANGEDESVIEAAIVDEDGQFVPTASARVTFTISGDAGPIAGSGNGDPNDHMPDASP